MKGTFDGNNSEVNINYPLMMIGAGRNKTFLTGYNVDIGGTKEQGKEVAVQDMTSSGAECGLYADNGLSFLCIHIYDFYSMSSVWCVCVQQKRKINQLCDHIMCMEWSILWL